MRTIALLLLLTSSPALALDQVQILSACYTDCEKEVARKPLVSKALRAFC